MRKITKTIKLKDLFYISEERLNDEVKKKQSNNTCFYDTFGQKKWLFSTLRKLLIYSLCKHQKCSTNEKYAIQIVTLFLQFSDENTDKESESYVGSSELYNPKKVQFI